MSNDKKRGWPKNIPTNMMPPGGMGQPQMHFSKEAIKSAKEMKCINEIPIDKKPGEFMQCGGEIFVDACRLRYISKIMSPEGRETIATVMIGKLCVACGKIFNPDEWKKENDIMEEGKAAAEGTKKESAILDEGGKPIAKKL